MPGISQYGPLRERIALVTGAGRGIGRAVALGLAAAGANVVLVARSADQLSRTAAKVADAGSKATVIQADLADRTEPRRVARAALDQFGRVDLLINNAATVAPLGPSTQVDIEAYTTQLDLNVRAVAVLTFALLPAMLESGWGRIVNVSSGIAVRPAGMIGGNAYATTKAALEAHTLNLAAELTGSGVTVNAFRPGSVDTAMQGWIRDQGPERIGRQLHERFVSSHRQGQLITPEQSAGALLTRLSSGDSGQIWDVG
jgi:NAD(P)-dependent dehydrogenase (short-subunit alcohol dehydrogenase family)